MTRPSPRNAYDDPELVSDLIGLAYDAAVVPDRWDELLARLGETLETRAASLVLAGDMPDGGVAVIPRSAGLDDRSIDAYERHYAAIDPYWAQAFKKPTGAVGTGSILIRDDAFLRTEFYHDYYQPAGLHRCFASIIHNDGESLSALVCHRGPDQRVPGEEELELLRLLTPHLQRARTVSIRLDTLASHERVTDGVLDRLLVGLVLVDAAGRFVSANARGEEILREQDGLGVSRGRLVTGRVRDTHALDEVIAMACATGQRRGNAAGASLRLPRPSGRRALEVMACPVDTASDVWSDARVCAFLVVNDGSADLGGAARRLRDLHALTDAEAELAAALASGATVKEWAVTRGVSVETVRWQLKQVFGKTGVSRQSDLLRLVLLGPAIVR